MTKSRRAASQQESKGQDNSTKSGLIAGITEYITNVISDADEVAAA